MYLSYLSLAKALKQCRKDKNLTQEELARFFGADASLIEKWETGIAEPTISEALILSKLYGISLDDICAGVDARTMIPAEALEAYECILLQNRMSKRWFN